MSQPNWDQNEPGRSVSSLSAPVDGEAAKRQEQHDRRAMFDRQERLEMRQARRLLLRQSMPWAVFGAIAFAFVGWGTGYVLGPLSDWISPGWTAPGALVNLVLGAICGALGGATAGAIFHSLSDEDHDAPFVVMGVATLLVLLGAIHGAGQGGVLDIALGIGIGIPVGIIAGLGVYILYWGLKWVYIWARKEFGAY